MHRPNSKSTLLTNLDNVPSKRLETSHENTIKTSSCPVVTRLVSLKMAKEVSEGRSKSAFEREKSDERQTRFLMTMGAQIFEQNIRHAQTIHAAISANKYKIN